MGCCCSGKTSTSLAERNKSLPAQLKTNSGKDANIRMMFQIATDHIPKEFPSSSETAQQLIERCCENLNSSDQKKGAFRIIAISI